MHVFFHRLQTRIPARRGGMLAARVTFTQKTLAWRNTSSPDHLLCFGSLGVPNRSSLYLFISLVHGVQVNVMSPRRWVCLHIRRPQSKSYMVLKPARRETQLSTDMLQDLAHLAIRINVNSVWRTSGGPKVWCLWKSAPCGDAEGPLSIY